MLGSRVYEYGSQLLKNLLSASSHWSLHVVGKTVPQSTPISSQQRAYTSFMSTQHLFGPEMAPRRAMELLSTDEKSVH
jgi:hypothetical protein